MVVVNRFRWFGWFVLCVGVILVSYLTSSRVAAERKKLAEVERAIGRTDREIKALETEFDTRANLVQLEQWNADTLKLTAPTAQQYLPDEGRLADVSFDAPQPGANGNAKVQAAALVIPGPPVDPTTGGVVAQPKVAVAAPVAKVSAPARVIAAVASVPTAPGGAKLIKASATAKPKTVAMIDRGLLSDSTLGDLVAGARKERGKR